MGDACHGERMKEHDRRMAEMHERHARMIAEAAKRHEAHIADVMRRHDEAMRGLDERLGQQGHIPSGPAPATSDRVEDPTNEGSL